MNFAKSSSSPSLKRQSTGSDESPKPRSKSKDRQKSPFLLWIPDYIESVENELQSKLRTLELLKNETLPLDKAMQEQLLARDCLITSLNKTILELKTSIKSTQGNRIDKDMEKEFSQLEQEVNELKTFKKKSIEQLNDLQLKQDQERSKWVDEKDELALIQDTLKEEIEEYKSIINIKDSILNETSADLLKLQEVIISMNKLNSDMHSKLEEKNKELEDLTLKTQEFIVKAKQAEELEKRLDEYILKNLETERKFATMLGQVNQISRVNNIIEWAGKNIDILEENTKKQYEVVSKVSSAQNEKLFLDLGFYFKELVGSLETIKHNLIANKPKAVEGLTGESNLRNLLKEKELELAKNTDYINLFKVKEAALEEKVNQIQMLMERNRIDYKNQINELEKLPSLFNDQMSKFALRKNEMQKEMESLAAQLGSCKIKISHLTGKFEQSHKRKKELQESEMELRKVAAELREKIRSMIEYRKDAGKVPASHELKIKKIVKQAQILRDEVFRKDSELVQMARERIRFQADVELQKQSYQKLANRMKNLEANVMEKVNEDLQEKDRQIQILKEMLRSAHSEIKIKDMKISGSPKRPEEFERFRSPRRGTIM